MNSQSSKLNRMKAAMAAAAITGASVGMAEAASLAVNFRGSAYAAAGANVTADAYGVAVANWVNAPDSETGTTFVTSGVSVTWTAANDWAQGTAATAGNGEVNFGYIDDTGNTQTLTLSGLAAWLTANSATGYTIQLIQSSDNATGFVDTALSASNGGASLGTLTNAGTGPGGDFASATSTSGTLTSDTLFIDPANRNGTNRATIAGIIITTAVPEPSALLLGGLGLFSLMRRRRH